ncbi:MAG: Hsp20/alpha crystallin family protein [Verrucomicrobiota bacterium]|nr:Hsp20/alpha crystallin family protein [Verrucomicrobiota bacterium]
MCKISSSVHFTKRAQSAYDQEPETHWAPNTDVYVMEDGLVIKVELAGMRREDLELTIDENRLRIAGQRPDGCRAPHCKFLVMEINYGVFESVIELPAGYDLSRAKAAYQNGFLRVDVPVQARVSTKKLSVQITGR